MADARSLSVRLRAEVLSYVTGMKQAAAATKGMTAAATEAAATHKQASRDISRASLISGAALLAVGGIAVKTAADFDKSMSGVRAATHETAANMSLLREAAIQAGAATAFTATDAANAERELAKAGVSTADVLSGGLAGALSLAAAGQLEVGQSAEIAATAMTQFHLAGKDIPHVADLLAAGAGKAQGEVTDLAQALQYVGPVAAGMGVSIEQTTGALALFASQGQIGERAGTGLRGVLLSLTSPGKQAAAQMASLGINLYDANGQFIGLDGAAQELRDAFVNLAPAQRDAALGVIFGNQQVTAARVLYAGGAAAVDSWTRKVDDAGYASKTAAIQLDNLRGDIEKLTGSLQSDLIEAGSGANTTLRGMTQGATGAANAFGEMPGAVQGGATALVALGGTALVAVGAFGTLAPKVTATRTALAEMGAAGQVANRGLGALGKAGGYGIAILALGETVRLATNELTKLQGRGAPAVDALTSSLVKFADSGRIAGAGLQGVGAQSEKLAGDLDTLNALGNEGFGWVNKTSFGLFGRDMKEAGDRVDALDQSLAGLVSGGHADVAKQIFEKLAAQVKAAGGSVPDLKAALDDYTGALTTADTQQHLAAGSAAAAGGAIAGVTPEAKAAADALKDYASALDDTVAIDAYTANANLAKSYHDLSKSLKDAGSVTNDEKIALGGFAKDVKSTARAVLDQSGSQDKANAAMGRGRDEFIALAIKAGKSAAAAERLADRLGLIKSPPPIRITLTGIAAALAQVAALNAQFRNLGVHHSVSVGGRTVGTGVTGAEGGFVSGPGTATSDDIPAYLSNGEYVMRAAAVAKYGTHHFDRLNAMQFAAGGLAADKKPSAADRAEARRDAAGAAAAATVAGRVGPIGRRTPGTDSVAEITAAIAAVERLTAAYAAQQAVVGMNSAERHKYHAEQKVTAVQERLEARKTAATAREEAAQQLADNKAGWNFDHLTADQQLAALDKKIAGEKKYSNAWVADSKAREQIAADMAAKEQQAAEQRLQQIKSDLDAAIQERESKIASVTSIFSSFGAVGQGMNVPGGANEVIGAQVGGTDVITGGLIAASQAAKLSAARTFIANLRTLRSAGLNAASLQEILAMGPSGGAAYAAALVADGSVLGSINSSQSQLAALGQSFGAEMAGPARYMVGQPNSGPTTFNIVDANGVLLGTMYGAAQQVAGQIANSLVYGRAG